MIPFEAFPKIPRLNREIVITEKLDGTNAVVHIGEDEVVTAGSRTRWISPENDNYGFAKWVRDNQLELRKLGPGTHFGEWWGAGIQRRYDLSEKRFSLFNVHRWSAPAVRPACCHVVPTLYRGAFDQMWIDRCVDLLRTQGSVAAPGFMKPEGVIVFHTAASALFKVTVEKDEEPKGKAEWMAKQAAAQ
jgi:hypothetical protein